MIFHSTHLIFSITFVTLQAPASLSISVNQNLSVPDMAHVPDKPVQLTKVKKACLLLRTITLFTRSKNGPWA